MNTAQTMYSEKQHIPHSFILFTSQNSTDPENYLYRKNDICACGGWQCLEKYTDLFLPMLSRVFIYLFYFMLFFIYLFYFMLLSSFFSAFTEAKKV
jgi:hypothetical protein